MNDARKKKLSELMRQLEVSFKDDALLERALMHSSASADSYERLEFLGDAVLGFVVTDMLYRRYRDKAEGVLSRMRASLVSEASLAALAERLNLADYIVIGGSELRNGSGVKPSIMADVIESVLGALYLDAGLPAVMERVERWLSDDMAQVATLKSTKDPKTRLQELLQSDGKPLPVYHLVNTVGKSHNQTFYVACEVEGRQARTEGAAKNKRQAEQLAAEAMLHALGEDV